MSKSLERGLAILEFLSKQQASAPLIDLSKKLSIPLSATHRLLNTLVREGYARQEGEMGNYSLSLKAVSLGMLFLSKNELLDLARPILAQLAEEAGELSRLGLIDGQRIVWVARSQGRRAGLRYDPNDGAEAPLHCTASGFVWLAQMPEVDALKLLRSKGFGDPAQFGPDAPTTEEEVMDRVREARKKGFAIVQNSAELGMSAIAAPILNQDGVPVGVLTIAGPVVRLTEAKMKQLAPKIIQAAKVLALMDDSLVPVVRTSRAGA